MIDLLKNYKELRNGPGYVSSLRYYLAKKKLDVQLLSNKDSLRKMAQLELRIGLVTPQKSANWQIKSHIVLSLLFREPNPLFSHHRVPINSPHLNASAILSNTITPPRGPVDEKGTFKVIKKTIKGNLSTKHIQEVRL